MIRGFSRGRRLAAALAVATAGVVAPAGSASAATPCANPEGTLVQGYAGDRYVLVQQAPGLRGAGTRVCFQSGGAQGGDVYRVLEIPASAGGPRFDNNADACRYYGGRTILPDPAGVGSLVVSEHSTATEQWVCFEMPAIRYNVRMKLSVESGAAPTVQEVTAPPARDTSLVDRSETCGGPGTTQVMDLFVTQSLVEVTHTAPDPTGRTTACVRAQDAATGVGAGGTFGTDMDLLTRIETSSDTSRCWYMVAPFLGTRVDGRNGVNLCVSGGPAAAAHVLIPIPEPEEEELVFEPHADTPLMRVSDDLSPCTKGVTWMDAPDYLHIDRSEPIGDGPTSVCVSTAPGSGTRYEIQFPQDGPVQVSSDVSPCTHSLDRVGGVHPSVDSSFDPGAVDIGAKSYSVCVSVWGPGSGVRLQLTVPEVDPRSAPLPGPVALPSVDTAVASTSEDTTSCTQAPTSSSVYDDTVHARVWSDAPDGEVPGTVCLATSQTDPVSVRPTLAAP